MQLHCLTVQAYVDLDNDGDLDIITNNINQAAFCFDNNTRQSDSLNNHFIKLRLKGDSLNTRGFGAKLNCIVTGWYNRRNKTRWGVFFYG
jgi:hypothetical protein